MKSTVANPSTHRFKAKCSYCNKIFDGKPINFPKHILIECVIVTPSQKSAYSSFVDITRPQQSEFGDADSIAPSESNSTLSTNIKRKSSHHHSTPLNFIPFGPAETKVFLKKKIYNIYISIGIA